MNPPPFFIRYTCVNAINIDWIVYTYYVFISYLLVFPIIPTPCAASCRLAAMRIFLRWLFPIDFFSRNMQFIHSSYRSSRSLHHKNATATLLFNLHHFLSIAHVLFCSKNFLKTKPTIDLKLVFEVNDPLSICVKCSLIQQRIYRFKAQHSPNLFIIFKLLTNFLRN